MNMTENANIIEALQRIGFTDAQITSLMLAIEGRITLDEWEKRYTESDPKK